MKTLFVFVTSLLACASVRADSLLLIVGAPGEETYEKGFAKAADTWVSLAEEAQIPVTRVEEGTDEELPSAAIKNWIQALPPDSPETAWIVYLGHGTSTRASTKLNLHGPDLELEELADWLDPIESPLVFVHGGSASAPFIPALSRPGRILITATKSGAEQNYARFGEVFAETLQNQASDLDLDGQVSLLEAFITASTAVERFYEEAGRLSSEHALLDDNGDGQGISAESFKGLRPIVEPLDGKTLDGQRARTVAFLPAKGDFHLTEEKLRLRNELERRLEKLKSEKRTLPESEYFIKLELIFDELAKVYLQSEDS